jgi:hypothetical protein
MTLSGDNSAALVGEDSDASKSERYARLLKKDGTWNACAMEVCRFIAQPLTAAVLPLWRDEA